MSSVKLEALERIGGVVCLDFVNTVDPRYGPARVEYLPDYQALVDWSVGAGLLDAEAAAHLGSIATRRPNEARAIHRRAIDLREAVVTLLRGVGGEPTGALATLNGELAKARRREILHSGTTFKAKWPDSSSLDRVLWPIAESTAELLTSDQLGRVRECEGERCGWVFLDTSKAGRRRWCSMADCGNRAKAKRRRAIRSLARK
jgi:predicted RNA-binding Zn ribbon-like protein